MKVLITGGSSDISRAIIQRRIDLGNEVFFTSHSQEAIEETQAFFAGKAEGILFDLSEPTANAAAFKKLESCLDALVLCACSKQKAIKPFHDFSFPEFQVFTRMNLEGNAWLLHQLIPGMVKRKFGRLVFISSLSAAAGTSRYPAYCTAKAAIEGLFLNLAVDYAEYGVYSNIVRPGVIATSRNAKRWERTGYAEKIKTLIPACEIGTANQVASAVDLVLERDSYMNGAVIPVGGGLPLLRTAGLLTL